MHPAEQYIEDVISNKILTCEYVKLAVNRHLKDLKEGHKRGLWFDEDAANLIIDFFSILVYHKGELANKNIILEPWQQCLLWIKWGWKREDGTRRFRESYVEVARKNFKTGLEAGEALFHLVLDGESGAQVYCGATREEQALILVNDAGQIAKKTPSLNRILETYEYQGKIRRVVYRDKGGFIAPLGRDSNTQDGFDPSMGIMDERHAHKTNDVSNVIQSGMGSRRQPMLSSITTAGFDRTYPCYNLRKTVIEILKGVKQDDSFFGIIYTLDDKDDWRDPTNWIKANPNLGVSVGVDFLTDQLTKAKNEQGSAEVNFKTKNLNIWTDAAATWISDNTWMKCKGDLPDLIGVECFGGLDLASTSDFTAYALVFNLGKSKGLKVWFWIPEETVDKRERNGQQIRQWIKEGWIKVTPGNVADYDFIEADIKKINQDYNVRSSAYDDWNSTQIITHLTNDGLIMNKLIQGFKSLSAPTKEFERMVRGGTLIHDGNPVMRWMMANIVIQMDPAENIKLDKGKASEKIDGPAATVNAIGEFLTFGNKVEETASIEIW